MAAKNTVPIITFTTDFFDDYPRAHMEAVILSENSATKTVTISNSVTPFSILEGAFLLAAAHSHFPPGTIHVGVVDPGVGTARQGIVATTSDYTYVGPNNGLFAPAVGQNLKNLYKIEVDSVNPNHTNTFHGRDIFAKLAALLSRGEKISDYTTPLPAENFVDLELVQNQIVHIDNYGNLKVYNDCSDYSPGDMLTIRINQFKKQIPYVRTFGDVNPGEFLAYQGSNGVLEIAVNLGSANQIIRARVGDTATIS